MKHALIIAHPAAQSFTATMSKAYAAALVAHGPQLRLEPAQSGCEPGPEATVAAR